MMFVSAVLLVAFAVVAVGIALWARAHSEDPPGIPPACDRAVLRERIRQRDQIAVEPFFRRALYDYARVKLGLRRAESAALSHHVMDEIATAGVRLEVGKGGARG